MLGGKCARRQGHSHSAEQGGQERHQAQKLLGPLQRLAQLGAARLGGFNAHAAQRFGLRGCVFGGTRRIGPAGGLALDLRVAPGHKARHGGVFTGQGQAVVHAAGRLHQGGGGNVCGVDHHTRGKVHKARTPVGLAGNECSNLKLGAAQHEHVPNAQAQRVEQLGVHPHRACGRNAGRGLLRRAGAGVDAQRAAQRIACFDCLKRHQLAGATHCVGRARHGLKAQGLRLRQAQALGLLGKHGRRGSVGSHYGVAAEQLARVALQAALQAVSEKTDRRERGHSQCHRHHQEPQLARAHIAPQSAPAKAPKRLLHRATLSQKP